MCLFSFHRCKFPSLSVLPLFLLFPVFVHFYSLFYANIFLEIFYFEDLILTSRIKNLISDDIINILVSCFLLYHANFRTVTPLKTSFGVTFFITCNYHILFEDVKVVEICVACGWSTSFFRASLQALYGFQILPWEFFIQFTERKEKNG
jgi:hypothetical protein